MSIELNLEPPPRPEPDIWDDLLAAGSSSGALPGLGDKPELFRRLVEATHGKVDRGSGIDIWCATLGEMAVVLSAAVAALTGEDIRAELNVNIGEDSCASLERIARLPRPARETVRHIVRHIVLPATSLEQAQAAISQIKQG